MATQFEDQIERDDNNGVRVRNSCAHLYCLSSDLAQLPNPNSPCVSCLRQQGNWLCLFCKVVLCGRSENRHMLQHFELTGHCLVIGYDDPRVWCYACNAFLNVQVIPQLQTVFENFLRLKLEQSLPLGIAGYLNKEDNQADARECDQGNAKERRRRRRARKRASIQEESTEKSNDLPLEYRSTVGVEGALGESKSNLTSKRHCFCGQLAAVKTSESKNDKKYHYICKENKCEFSECCLQDGMLPGNEAHCNESSDKVQGDSKRNLSGLKLSKRHCVCGQEAVAKISESKNGKSESLEHCLLPGNEAESINEDMSLVKIAELRAEIHALTAKFNGMENHFGLIKMLILINVFYGLMLVIFILLIFFKI